MQGTQSPRGWLIIVIGHLWNWKCTNTLWLCHHCIRNSYLRTGKIPFNFRKFPICSYQNFHIQIFRVTQSSPPVTPLIHRLIARCLPPRSCHPNVTDGVVPHFATARRHRRVIGDLHSTFWRLALAQNTTPSRSVRLNRVCTPSSKGRKKSNLCSRIWWSSE